LAAEGDKNCHNDDDEEDDDDDDDNAVITDKTDINNNDIDRLYRCIVNTIMLSCNVILHSGVACWFTSQQATTLKAS